MKRNLLPLVIAGIFCSPALAHESATAEYGTLGKVNFANSCDAAIQEDLQRAVAMLHSFWFVAAEKSFAIAVLSIAIETRPLDLTVILVLFIPPHS